MERLLFLFAVTAVTTLAAPLHAADTGAARRPRAWACKEAREGTELTLPDGKKAVTKVQCTKRGRQWPRVVLAIKIKPADPGPRPATPDTEAGAAAAAAVGLPVLDQQSCAAIMESQYSPETERFYWQTPDHPCLRGRDLMCTAEQWEKCIEDLWSLLSCDCVKVSAS